LGWDEGNHEEEIYFDTSLSRFVSELGKPNLEV
jgi:hypothetical protein